MKALIYFLLVIIISFFTSFSFLKESTMRIPKKIEEAVKTSSVVETDLKETKIEVIDLLEKYVQVNQDIKNDLETAKKNIKTQ